MSAGYLPLSLKHTHTHFLRRKREKRVGNEWSKWFTDFLFKSQLSQVRSGSAHPILHFCHECSKKLDRFNRRKMSVQTSETIYLRASFTHNFSRYGFLKEWKWTELWSFFSFLFLADSLYICICWRKKIRISAFYPFFLLLQFIFLFFPLILLFVKTVRLKGCFFIP
jgi:hypothetical protein